MWSEAAWKYGRDWYKVALHVRSRDAIRCYNRYLVLGAKLNIGELHPDSNLGIIVKSLLIMNRAGDSK